MAEKKYIYQQIRDYLLDYIARKHNTPDLKLPSENQLCAKFGVSRITAKNAVLLLQKEGLVYRIQGKGTFIRGGPSAPKHQSRKDGIICLFLPNLASPFILDIIRGCSDFISKMDEQLFILSAQNSQSQEIQSVRRSLEKGAKGFIVFSVNGEYYNKELFKLALTDFPIVFIDRVPAGFDLSSVTTDHIGSSYSATEYLVSSGRKNIGIILKPPANASSLNDRLTGYEKALITNGITINTEERLFLKGDGPFKQRIVDFLKANPQLDALVSIGDTIGLDVYRAIKHLHIQVPSRLSIIFFDNEYDHFKDMLPFTPTVITQQAYNIGYEAARVLTDLLTNPVVEISKVLLPSKLILGQSTVVSTGD